MRVIFSLGVSLTRVNTQKERTVRFILGPHNRKMGMGAVMDSDVDTTPKAKWARRMMKAHRNAVENLVIFAPLVLALQYRHAT